MKRSDGLANLLRYALSDLRHRWPSTLLNKSAVALAVVYGLLLGHFAVGIYAYQRDVMGESIPTKVVATVPDVTDTGRRFTSERVASLRARRDVRAAFPHVSLNVGVSLSADRMLNVPAEGTVPEDPALRSARMAWGGAITSPGAKQIVLGRALFEKLGGTAAPAPLPTALTVEVRRTVKGRKEVYRMELRVVGLLARQRADRVFMPLDLVGLLDLWCTSKIETVPQDGQGLRAAGVTYPFCLAYVRAPHVARVADEARQLRVSAERDGEVEVSGPRGEVWAALGGRARSLDARDGVLARSSVVEATVGPARVLALSRDDPRWPGGRPPAWQTLLRTPGAAPLPATARRVGFRRLPPGFPASADYVGTRETLRWLRFDPRRPPAVRPYCWVDTDDFRVGLRLSALWPEAVAFKGREGLALFAEPRVAGGAAAPDLPGEAYLEGRVDLDEAEGPRAVTALFVPDEWFARAAGLRRVPNPFAVVPCIYFTKNPDDARTELSAWPRPLRPVQIRKGKRELLWIPARYTPLVDPAARKSGLALWGRWIRFAREAAALMDSGWRLLPDTARGPRDFVALVPGRKAQVGKQLGKRGVHQVAGVDCSIAGSPYVLVSRRELTRERHPDPRVHVAKGHPASLAVATANWRSADLEVASHRLFPPRVAVVSEKVFTQTSFHRSASEPSSLGRVMTHVCFEGPLALQTAQRRGIDLRPLTALTTSRLVRYRVFDARARKAGVRKDLVTAVDMSRPTFIAARPWLSVRGALASPVSVLYCEASDHADPGRFAGRLVRGSWLRKEGGLLQVVLPLAHARKIRPDDPAGLLGRDVTVRFVRNSGAGPDDALVMPLRVVGLADVRVARAPLGFVAGIHQWERGKMVFNEARREFVTPVEVSVRRGHVRCNVFADQVESVPGVVQALRAMGYHTEDQLAEQEGLRELGRVLGFVVSFFTLGCIVSAVLNVLVATMMNVKSKTWEIGILRAHGVGGGAILGLFAVQGLAVGLGAFVAGTTLVALFEPNLRSPLTRAFSLPDASILGSTAFTAAPWWLFALALGLSILFSLLGVFLPAIWACRLSPVNALRRRE